MFRKYVDIMSVERFSPFIPSSTQVLAHVSDWGARLVAPLGSSLMSKDGMIELAGRVYWIVGLVIASVLVARKYGYLTGRATPPDSSSTNPTGVNTGFSNLLRDVKELKQLMHQEEQVKLSFSIHFWHELDKNVILNWLLQHQELQLYCWKVLEQHIQDLKYNWI